VTGMDAKFWLDVAQWVFMAIGVLYVWTSNKHKATREQIEKMDERAVALKLRLTALETDLKHIPSSQSFNNLALQFEGLHGDFKKIGAELQGVRDLQSIMRSQTEMMDQFLRANK